ncbi:hypothetical protein PINS_up005600 [Pythium insidiosum]|nr:hypothetical protein PINS_up005600 [Pythium insidiosum]
MRNMNRPTDVLDEIRWTLAAIRRRRCEQLTRFVTLIDFVVLDSYHSLISRSIQALRDALVFGANANPISSLLRRDDFVLAFHKTMREQTSRLSAPSDVNRIHQRNQLVLSKQETKRFLRLAWEKKTDEILRQHDSQQADDSSRTSDMVWLESRLDGFFMNALKEKMSSEAERFTIDDILSVVDETMVNALLLPTFQPSKSILFLDTSEAKNEGTRRSSQAVVDAFQELQSVDALAPVALFHVSLVLVKNDNTKQCQIGFKPPLHQIQLLITELISSFISLFRDIPAIMSRQDLRAILSFAEDVRSFNISSSRDSQTDTQDGEYELKFSKTNFDRLDARIADDNLCSNLRLSMDELLKASFSGVGEFCSLYTEILEQQSVNDAFQPESVRCRFVANEYGLKEMENDVEELLQQVQRLESLSTSQMIEVLQLGMSELKQALLPSPKRCLSDLERLFPQLLRERCENFLTFIRGCCQKIERPPAKDLEKFALYLLYLKDVNDSIQEKEFDLTMLHDFFSLLSKLNLTIPPSVIEVFDLCEPEFEALKSQVNEAMSRRESDINDFSPYLTHSVTELTRGLESLKEQSSNSAINQGNSSAREAREQADSFEKQAASMSKQSATLVWIQNVFNEFAHSARPPLEEFVELKSVSSELKMKNDLWEAVCSAEEYLVVRSYDTLRAIDLLELRGILQRVETVVKRLEESGLNLPALQRLRTCKSTLTSLSPVIRDLRNENMEDRHWTKLEHKMNCSFERQMLVNQVDSTEGEEESDSSSQTVKHLDLPLCHLLEINAMQYASLIHQVSEEASAEAAISTSFATVLQTWESREIPTQLRKDRDGRDAICVGDCTELLCLLEESEVLLRVMEGSTYARVIQAKLARTLHDVTQAHEVIDLLVICQQKWDYLQRLVSVDFARSFSDQAKRLQQCDTVWRAMMEHLLKQPLCALFTTNNENRASLQSVLQGFELVSRCVDQHLEVS